MSANCSKVLSLILEIAAVPMIDARIAKTYSCRTNKTKSFESPHYRNQFYFPIGKIFPFNNHLSYLRICWWRPCVFTSE